MGAQHQNKRSNLFLVRVWTRNSHDGSGEPEWEGKVQRVVDGESHQFNDWQGLGDQIVGMLTEKRPLIDISETTGED